MRVAASPAPSCTLFQEDTRWPFGEANRSRMEHPACKARDAGWSKISLIRVPKALGVARTASVLHSGLGGGMARPPVPVFGASKPAVPKFGAASRRDEDDEVRRRQRLFLCCACFFPLLFCTRDYPLPLRPGPAAPRRRTPCVIRIGFTGKSILSVLLLFLMRVMGRGDCRNIGRLAARRG